ncbi:MAG TPA: type III pantothenate kinase [Gammaproteobacteria bacterium]|nr:type III pantothenate kinase [Gammaproteobacteria bacterium]
MKLLVDVGNSRIKWAFLEKGTLGQFGDVTHDGYKLDDVLAAAWHTVPKPSAVMVSNVAGPMANHIINELARNLFDVAPAYAVSSAQAAGVTSGYRDPARLGVDRWLALIGAFNRHSAPACVIDCGTAITIDAIAQDGRHLGGVIAPGVQLMRHALVGATAGISDEPGEVTTDVFARDTRSAVAGGAINAAIGLIERVSARMQKELGDKARRFITGGDAERLLPYLGQRYKLVPNLVLEGLAVLAERQS